MSSRVSPDFYAGIITSLAVLYAHDSEVEYREIVNLLDKRALVRHARENNELEFSGLIHYGYARERKPEAAS